MDDDGATASASTNISVLNIPPTAKIEMELLETTLMEGDNITLYGTQSSDSPYDMSVMAYQWDSNHFDSDLNGQTVGDIDFTGDTWNIQNLPAGTWTIVLTVIDDNGESDTTSMTFVVKAKPSDGILDSIESSIGSTATYIITTLLLVIIILLGFMMVKPKHVEYTGDLHQSIFDASPHSPLEQKRDVFDQEFSMSTQPQDGFTPEQPSLSTTQLEPQAPTSHAGPPLPSTGLPEGWSMEQWEYYGEQWLAANSSPKPATQPIPSQTHETSPSTKLQSLLDDLDF